MMIIDQFYQAINYEFFYQWILSHQKDYIKDQVHFTIQEDSPTNKTIIFKKNKSKGRITIWSNQIVEEEITHLETQNLLFYLHYTISDFSQACHLFHKFYQAFLKESYQRDYHIALCCTGGFSTALFAEEMREACLLTNSHFCIESLSLSQIEQSYQNYDAIYLAPQIAYMQSQLMKLVKNQIAIHRINPTDFATKQYASIFKTIQDNIKTDTKKQSSHQRINTN
jgi:Phosphotransferase system cellobiose-specific component IIB